jgi:branched-chain amino acid transport system substrate-binding protein
MQILFRVVLTALMLLFLVPAVPSRAQQATGEPYEVNAILPMTGPAAFLGSSEMKALHAVETLANDSGGIHGRPLRFVVQDDQTNPQVAVQLINALISKKVPAILGPGSSAPCAAVASLLNGGPVAYCLSPAIHPPKGSYQFSASVGTGDLLAMSIHFLRLSGWSHVAVLDATDATGQDFDRLLDSMGTNPESKNLVITGHEHFTTGDVSVQAQVSRLAAAKPQAVIVWTTGTGLGAALHAIHDIGLDVPVITTAGNMVASQIAQYATIMPKRLLFTGTVSAGVTPGPRSAAMTRYVNALKDAGAAPDFGTNIVWDPAMIVVDALRALPANPAPDKVRDWILGLHGWTGIDGTYDFRDGSQRGVGQNATALFQWDAPTSGFLAASRPGGAPL